MVGQEIKEIKEKYYFINGSYIDIINKESNIKKIIEKYKNKTIYKLLLKVQKIIIILGMSL